MQKQARQLNIESNSKRFLEAVRCFWMPRLLQKVEQTSSSSLKKMSSQSSNHSQLSDCTVPALSTFSPLPNKIADNSNHSFENSSSVTSQSLYPTDFMNISEQTGIPEHLTSPNVYSHTCVYNNSQILNESYNIGSSGYDMEGFSQASMSTVGSYEGAPSACQMGEGNWICNEMTDTLWNMDDIWQFRELGEMGN